MGGDTGYRPNIGGVSGQGGGRKMPAVQTGIGELILVSDQPDTASDTNYTDRRPRKPKGSFTNTVWSGQGGGSGQAGNGNDLEIYRVLSNGTSYAYVAEGGGGGGWGAAGGSAKQLAYMANGVTPSPTIGGNLGAAGGKAIKTNGHAVTWLSGSSRAYGAIG